MARRKQFPVRPAKSFRVSSVQMELSIVANHTRAGFKNITDDVVCRRFYQYIEFLQRHRLTVRSIATSLDFVTPATELRSDDLTLEGYRFVQYSHDKWLGRLYKDTGHEREAAFLDKWYQRFRQLPQEAFASDSGT